MISMVLRAILCCVFVFEATMPALARPARLGGGGGVDVPLLRILLALVLCTMLAIGFALLLKRGGGRFDLAAASKLFARLPGERRIEVIESRRASQHADICLVRCDDREYLLLCSAQQQQILREIGPAGAAPQAEAQ